MSNFQEIVTPEGKTIKIIPATKSLHPERDGVAPSRKKVRVAAYCRVSTSLEEQQGSFAMQKSYYESLINNRPDWELVGIYGDEGKSGTSLKGRTGLLDLMDDVRAGRIDHVIMKATSRLSRNTVDFISVLDELEYYGVGVSFESEGIITSGQQNRTMLQIMGATNEQYSNTLSNNVRWSKERSMREGKVSICYGNFLGYKKGADGEPEVIPKEAEVVKQIFNMFLSGLSYASIASELNNQGILTKKGKAWIGEAIRRILINEKYTGDVLLQKTYKKSYLDKRCHKNNGEKPQVLVKNNHVAIIDHETFAKAKELMAERSKRKTKGTAKSPLVGRIVCDECGEIYGHKTWNSRGNIRYSAWVCRNKYTEETTYGGKKCKTPNLREEWITSGYIIAINQFLAQKTANIAKYERKLARIDYQLGQDNKQRKSGLEYEVRQAEERIREIEKTRVDLSHEWEYTYGKNDEFLERQNELKNEMKEAMNQKKALEQKQAELRARKSEITRFIKNIQSLPDKLTKFDNQSFTSTINFITVKKDALIYQFYGEEYIRVPLEEAKKSTS